MQQTLCTVYPCGYSRDAALIAHLMQQDPQMLLIDTRAVPRSQLAAWNERTLQSRYGARYRWAGKFLGNRNHATGGPIELMDVETGIRGLVRYLQEGHALVLLCGCRDYHRCHLHVIVELLQATEPAVQVILPETLTPPGTVQCISIRQPWTWILTHPEIVQSCGLPPKEVENREWSTTYRGQLYLHAGSQVEKTLFDREGRLDHWYWQRHFGSPGARLAARMPQTSQEYPRKAIVGKAALVEVVETVTSPWFMGRYGLLLQDLQSFEPIFDYPGQRRLFSVPQTVLEHHCSSSTEETIKQEVWVESAF